MTLASRCWWICSIKKSWRAPRQKAIDTRIGCRLNCHAKLPYLVIEVFDRDITLWHLRLNLLFEKRKKKRSWHLLLLFIRMAHQYSFSVIPLFDTKMLDRLFRQPMHARGQLFPKTEIGKFLFLFSFFFRDKSHATRAPYDRYAVSIPAGMSFFFFFLSFFN